MTIRLDGLDDEDGPIKAVHDLETRS